MDNNFVNNKISPLMFFFLLLALLLASLFLSGCTRTVYMPTETVVESRMSAADTVRTERMSKLIDQLQSAVRTREKVIVRDSVIYVVNEQGAVVSREVYHGSDRDYSESEAVARVTQVYDSLFHRQTQRVDSLLSEFRREPVSVVAEPSLWDKIKTGLTVGVIGWLAIGIFFLVRWLKSKFFH